MFDLDGSSHFAGMGKVVLDSGHSKNLFFFFLHNCCTVKEVVQYIFSGLSNIGAQMGLLRVLRFPQHAGRPLLAASDLFPTTIDTNSQPFFIV